MRRSPRREVIAERKFDIDCRIEVRGLLAPARAVCGNLNGSALMRCLIGRWFGQEQSQRSVSFNRRHGWAPASAAPRHWRWIQRQCQRLNGAPTIAGCAETDSGNPRRTLRLPMPEGDYPAQQDSCFTSLVNAWAASFSPSTMVRYGKSWFARSWTVIRWWMASAAA